MNATCTTKMCGERRRATETAGAAGYVRQTAPERFSFPQGLPGFADCREFVMAPSNSPGLFWLRSTDAASLVFLLADPFAFFDGYSVDLCAADVAMIGADAACLTILAIVTLPGEGEEDCTVNLKAPLLFDLRLRRGCQLVLAGPDQCLRTPLPMDALQQHGTTAPVRISPDQTAGNCA